MDKQRLERYTKEYGCRYTRRQKNKFLEVLHKEMAECGYESTDIQGKRLFSRANNVLYGNVKQMKQVIVVPYAGETLLANGAILSVKRIENN